MHLAYNLTFIYLGISHTYYGRRGVHLSLWSGLWRRVKNGVATYPEHASSIQPNIHLSWYITYILWAQRSTPQPLEWTMAEGEKWSCHLDQVQESYCALQATHLHTQVCILNYGSEVSIRLGKVLDIQDCPAFGLVFIVCYQAIFK